MLDGIRIIEIEGLGPGPFAGMMLADLGAEVIVVQRETAPAGTAVDHSLLDRGKKSVILDLKDTKDRESLIALVATADALIEGFRPGVMERLGLGPEQFKEDHPRLVYGRLTGWGQSGPKSHCAGHDFNYAALSGALWYASEDDEPPFAPPTLVSDIGGGALYLVAGILAALIKAQRSGIGAVVDAAMVDGSAHMMNLLMTARAVGLVGRERGTSILDGSPWSRCYACADGRWLSVQCLEPKFYMEFRSKLGVEEDSAFDQNPNPEKWPALSAGIAAIIATKTLDEWSGIFEDSDACAAPVLNPEESARHPHIAAREIWVDVDGQLQARAAPRFDGQTPGEPLSPPRRGEHTEEILGNL